MDKKILGNFIIYFPPIAYMSYYFVTREQNSDIEWTPILITAFISMISHAIGKRIKTKGEVE